MDDKEITIQVPIALERLIVANNKLLKTYQSQLMQEVQDANEQMMNILQLNLDAGWKLDMERMVYCRPVEKQTSEEHSTE